MFAQKAIVVAQDGSGDFKSIQEAINSLPKEDNKTQRIITIKKGTYNEKLFIDKNFITLKGEDPANTIVTISLARDAWRCDNKDDYGVATINLRGSDIVLQNLSFLNSYGRDNTIDKEIVCASEPSGKKTIKPIGHQMALRSFGTTRLVVLNCIFRAWGGDTVSPWNTDEGMFYFKDCIMEGGVDFYCPRGWALAENCSFICHNDNAAIWHDGSKFEKSKTVLLNCKFSGDDGFKLGRYHRDAQFYLLNCNFRKIWLMQIFTRCRCRAMYCSGVEEYIIIIAKKRAVIMHGLKIICQLILISQILTLHGYLITGGNRMK
ncbi:MAG: pectinesterase family protein [Ferruginibacter sp.]